MGHNAEFWLSFGARRSEIRNTDTDLFLHGYSHIVVQAWYQMKEHDTYFLNNLQPGATKQTIFFYQVNSFLADRELRTRELDVG